MKQRAVALLLVLLLTLSGCVSVPSSPPINTPDYSAEFEGRWYYRHLSEAQQENYAAVYTAVREGFDRDATVTLSDNTEAVNGESITLPAPPTEKAAVEQLYTALLRDHPQLFYIGSSYSYEGYRKQDITHYNTLYLTYTMNAAERASANEKLTEAVNAVVAKAQGLSSQYDKELTVHDALLEICSYSDEAAESDQPLTAFPHDFTAYGALVNGKAVCEGYAAALQLLLNAVGIDGTPVSGYDTEQHPHMWNVVTVDGGTYYVDATWNDRFRYPSHLYFNMNTEDLLRSHTPDDENVGLSVYTDTAANFFMRSGHYVDDYDRDVIAALVAQAVAQGDTYIELRFAKDKFTSARLFVNDADWFRSQVEKHLPDKTVSLWPYAYTASSVYHVISIYKK